jgi:ankyrin repeat protein
VLGLAVYAGYWREIDAVIGACKEFATDTAKDGLLHLTMFYAARDAAKADAAYTGVRDAGIGLGPPGQWTRLHEAARAGLADRVAVLVAAGADVNARDKRGSTALYRASECGHTAVVTALLACPGVNVNLADVGGWTPLIEASCYGHTAVVAALLACPAVDANAASGGGYTPLYCASHFGHTSVVAALLAHPGILVNAAATDGRTPLKAANSRGHTEVVALLEAAGGVD